MSKKCIERITSRQSIRKFTNEQIPDSIIEEIRTVAHMPGFRGTISKNSTYICAPGQSIHREGDILVATEAVRRQQLHARFSERPISQHRGPVSGGGAVALASAEEPHI